LVTHLYFYFIGVAGDANGSSTTLGVPKNVGKAFLDDPKTAARGIRRSHTAAAYPPTLSGLWGERLIIPGGSSTENTLWGDYTNMTVDPVDDCTF
jgi:hypothetical protein